MRLRKGRSMRLRAGAKWSCVGAQRGMVHGRSVWLSKGRRLGLRWVAGCALAGAQHVAALGRRAGLRKGAARGRTGARHVVAQRGHCGAAQGRSVRPRWSVARGRTGAQRGGARGSGVELRLGAASGRAVTKRLQKRRRVGLRRRATCGYVGLRRGAIRGRRGAHNAAAPGRGVGLQCGAACSCAGGAVWGCPGPQPVATLERRVGLRWGATRARAWPKEAAARGRSMGPRKGPRGAALGRSGCGRGAACKMEPRSGPACARARAHWGVPSGRAGAQGQRKGRHVGWRRGAACSCAWANRGAGPGRSGRKRGAAWGCAGAQYVAAHGRSAELRMRYVWGRARV